MRQLPPLPARTAWIIGLLLLAPWLLATSPVEPPYLPREYRYRVSGLVLRSDSLTSPAGIPVLLVLRTVSGGDTAFRVLESETDRFSNPGEASVTHTDSAGRFLLGVTTIVPHDSIFIALRHPDHPPLYIGPLSQEPGSRQAIIQYPATTAPGCGCGTEPASRADTTGYSQVVSLPAIALPY